MGINKSIDAFFSESGNELINKLDISFVINSWSSFDSFPHDSESDQIHPPFLKIVDVFIIKR